MATAPSVRSRPLAARLEACGPPHLHSASGPVLQTGVVMRATEEMSRPAGQARPAGTGSEPQSGRAFELPSGHETSLTTTDENPGESRRVSDPHPGPPPTVEEGEGGGDFRDRRQGRQGYDHSTAPLKDAGTGLGILQKRCSFPPNQPFPLGVPGTRQERGTLVVEIRVGVGYSRISRIASPRSFVASAFIACSLWTTSSPSPAARKRFASTPCCLVYRSK
jgi:hypothetical protein